MRPMPELEITTVNVADLMPYAGNAKLHPHEQVDQIAASIEQFGNCDPIGVWHNDAGEMEIVEGHGRVMALNKLGIETAPVIFLDHLTDEQRRAYALVHNQLTMNSDFDTFAGDTSFGYVSASLGNEYTGIELRQEQCQFNSEATSGMSATYICDDGCNVLEHIEPDSQDLFFSCPPYYDLEVYSDLDRDASNQDTYEDFYAIIDTAFERAVQCLRDNRFAVIVVSDVRDKRSGGYYDLTGDIKATFKRCGLTLYNELVLLDAVGTARLRANRYMRNRKVVRVHQHVLVFYKGNTSKIQTEFPVIEVDYEGDDLEFQALD